MATVFSEVTREAWDYQAQPKETLELCNLCGGTDLGVWGKTDRYGLPVWSSVCHDCGLVFLNPRMTAPAYAAFYREGTYRKLVSAFHGREINAQTIKPEQLAYAEQLAAFLERHVSLMGGTLLDIGGSTGVVARALAECFGFTATVLDPATKELAEATGLTVINASIEDYEPRERFDLVTFCQTADHVLDLRGTLAKISRLLSVGGLFFVDIVDFEQTRQVKVDHPYNLTRATMLSYLAREGFLLKAEGRAQDGIHWRFLCA